MQNIEILFYDDSELAEYEALNRGYRGDIYVKKGSEFYNINAYLIERLIQEFEIEYEVSGYYSVDPNLIIVKEVNKNEIENTLKNLNEQEFFDNIKPISKEVLESMRKDDKIQFFTINQ